MNKIFLFLYCVFMFGFPLAYTLRSVIPGFGPPDAGIEIYNIPLVVIAALIGLTMPPVEHQAIENFRIKMMFIWGFLPP